jgi:hypothetical protein
MFVVPKGTECEVCHITRPSPWVACRLSADVRFGEHIPDRGGKSLVEAGEWLFKVDRASIANAGEGSECNR